MTDKTLALMIRIERRLNKLQELTACHCGHDELVDECIRYRNRLLKFIEVELDKMQQPEKNP